ncbi:MAG: proton-conducting transporter membrane subunit, partial [Pseudomonadota bacterium]
IYSLIGSLNLGIISNNMPGLLENNAARAGVGLILVGILMKSALFPLSNWLVNIYQNAPSFISSILSSVSNKVGIYLLLRFFFEVFKVNNYNFEYLEITLLVIAAIAIFACAIYALKQTNIKRFLAYSSLSQIGFIILSIALATSLSLTGSLIYCFTHAMEKLTLFLAVGYLIAYHTQSEKIEDFAGLARIHPWISIAIIINLLSTIGIPLTAGFVGKWQILKATLASDIWYILIISVAILFTFSYVFKFVEILIIQKPGSENPTRAIPKLGAGIIILITGLNLYIGLNHQYLLELANNISSILIK